MNRKKFIAATKSIVVVCSFYSSLQNMKRIEMWIKLTRQNPSICKPAPMRKLPMEKQEARPSKDSANKKRWYVHHHFLLNIHYRSMTNRRRSGVARSGDELTIIDTGRNDERLLWSFPSTTEKKEYVSSLKCIRLQSPRPKFVIFLPIAVSESITIDTKNLRDSPFDLTCIHSISHESE